MLCCRIVYNVPEGYARIGTVKGRRKHHPGYSGRTNGEIMIEFEIKAGNLFLYNEDLELMLAALNILMGEPNHQLCTAVYGEDTISVLKRRYQFLFEIYKSLHKKTGLFEHLLEYPMKGFQLSGFCKYLLDMNRTLFIRRYLEIDDEEIIEAALNTGEGLERFYFDHPDIGESFLAVQSFFRDTDRLIADYFAFAEDLRTDAFRNELEKHTLSIEAEQTKCKSGLAEMESMEYSQFIMGKTFHNRGPYSGFIFMPSVFVPYKAVRFFGRVQILFYSIRETLPDYETILLQLKTIADNTRLKIISLLNEKEPLKGMDIAKALSLASSTVSHHMEQLKNAGLVNEEQVKNSKYYSVSRNNIDELLSLLNDTLRKK